MADRAMDVISEVSRRYNVVLKDKQVEAIYSFMNGCDVFVALPTGYGKSLIYAFLPSVFDLYKGQEGSIVICISPLVSLMMDQKSKFTHQGIKAVFVGEEQTDEDAIRSVLTGKVQLVYISPENIMCNPLFRNMILSPLYKEKLVALVVDEAHCVKTWGDKFRLAYGHLGDIRSLLSSNVNIMALTATATNETYKAVCKRLSLNTPKLIGFQPNRSNIVYEVKPMIDLDNFCQDIARELKSLALEYPKTVIFVQRYSDCSAIYHTLRKNLGPHITFPPYYPIWQEYLLVDMYTRASTITLRSMSKKLDELVVTTNCQKQ
uniref:Helicase ATP-binding domain-containing protein n=1 Tax=Amphimedon queenslandica TaxID=400682 RepID=A0A1X7VKG1_AMPQE